MTFVLVGNYGAQNIGDEALREYFLSAFHEVEWKVVSASPSGPNEVPRLPFGLRSFFTSWPRTIGAIARSKAAVFGGGSLFTDIESVRACMMWWSYAFIARLFRKPVILAFQGIGPFRTRFGLLLAQWTAKRAVFISVRDDESLKRIEGWDLGCEPTLTFDPAFALFASHPKRTSGGRTLVLIPRTNSDDRFFSAAAEKIKERFDTIRILLMQPDGAEKRVGDRLRALAGSSAVVVAISSVHQLLDEISAASFVLSQRYHGALAALAMSVPMDTVPQGAGDKMDGLRQMGKDTQAVERWKRSIETGQSTLKAQLATLR
jgi:polysaccharide pyruvyl transferase WcaK-like protein